MDKKGIVLVFTGTEDPMWPFLKAACSEEEKTRLVLFPTDDPHIARLTYSPSSNEVLFDVRDTSISGSDLSGIWWRRTIVPDLNHFDAELRDYCIKEYQTFWDGFEDCLPSIRWVSRPSALQRARNKARQLSIAQQLGFTTLVTIFSNAPQRVREFLQKQPTIYKSINSPRIPLIADKHSTVFTTIVEEHHMKDLNGVLTCPGIFQEFCNKAADIRVTVFHKSVFSVRIESQSGEKSKVDFRRGARHLPHEAHQLPADVQDRCVSLVHELGLEFGAIDLALMSDDSYIFFEINPNGQWGWLEERTGLPMRRALLDYLLHGK